jgi:DNA-binding MarR family transcriptional regulator
MPPDSTRPRTPRPRAPRPRAPRPKAPQPNAADLADRLHSAAIHLLRRLRREDDASGLPAPQLSALSVIVFGGPLTLGALARAEQVRPPTISKLIVALEEQGLVEREVDAADRRVVRVRATARGSKLLHEGRQRRVAALVASLGALSARDRALLARALPVLERIARSAGGD